MTNDKTPGTGAAASAPSRVITQVVACDWQQAYAVASDPLRFHEWASGLAHSQVTPEPCSPASDPHYDGLLWRLTSPQGQARLRTVAPNLFGVMDHWVTPDGQAEVAVPFRVIGLGTGRCELQLTLIRQPTMDDAAFEHDARWIAKDLQALRQLLEKPPVAPSADD